MERRLAAIFVADMVGYSRHVHEAEESAVRLMSEYRAIIDSIIGSHGGRVFDSAGDSVLAEFGSSVEALRSAVEVQREIAAKNAQTSPAERMQFRIGLHLGDVVAENGKLSGEGVNIASRLQAMAEPDGILISSDLHRYVRRTDKMGFEDLGRKKLKNIAEPMQVYRVHTTPLPRWKQMVDSPLVRRRALLAAAAVGAAWFLAANTGLVNQLPKPLQTAMGFGSRLSSERQASLAVLPLRNVSNDASQDYYSDGLTQDLTGDLSQVKDLFVIASNSAFAYKGSSAKPETIAHDLGVVYVLTGTVKKQDGRVSVTAQLLDARTGKQVWGQNFDRNGQDVFGVQGNIIEAVANNLNVAPEKRPVRLAAADATKNATAYDHFLKGRQLFYSYTREDVAAARQEFTSAVGLDPGFARAYGWLGYTHLEDIQEGWTDDVKKSSAAALDWALKGAELDTSDYYTHWNLAAVSSGLKDMKRARKEYEAALALNANDADLLADMADMLSYSGEPERAIEQIERAKQFNPKYPDWYDWSLGFAYFQNRQYAEALASLEKMKDPPNNAYVLLAACKAKLGKPVPTNEVMAHVKAKDAAWTPDHLARFPFVKTEDQQHYLESFKSIGIDVPSESSAN